MSATAVLTGLLAASWKATLVVALLLVVRGLLGGWLPAAWRRGLWLLVALRLVLPVAPASPFSLFGLFAPGSAGPGRLLPGLGELAASAGSGGATGADTAAWSGLDILSAASLLLWSAGLLVIALRATTGWLRLRTALAAARPVADPALLGLLAGCRRTLGVRQPVDLAESDAVAGPAVFDPPLAGRACILLPSGLLDRLDSDGPRHVLLHELAHLKRRDGLAHRLGWLLTALHWFNPAVHYARRRMQVDCEQAADALVLARLRSAERAAYGHTLLRLVTPGPALTAPASLLTMTTTKRQLQRRIRMIARFRPHSLRRLPLLLALAAALALVALTDVGDLAAQARAASAPPAAAAPASDADAGALKATVDLVRSSGVALYRWYADQPAPAPSSGESSSSGAVDWNRCPRATHDQLTRLVVPRYISALPKTDGWGHPLEFCLRTDGGGEGFSMGVRSPGRDGEFEGDSYSPGNFQPEAVDRDVVWVDGYFVRWPERAATAGD